MKVLALLILVFFYIGTSIEGYAVDNLDFSNIWKLKCEAKAGNAAYTDFMAAVNQSNDCFRNVQESKRFERFEDYCMEDTTRNDFFACVKAIGEKVSACLEEEESYFPNFLASVFNHSITEFCGDEGKPKLKYIIESLADMNCFVFHFNFEKAIKKCTSESFNAADNMVDGVFIIKKSEICRELSYMENCVSESIKEQCSGTDHSKMVHYLIEPWLYACEAKPETSA